VRMNQSLRNNKTSYIIESMKGEMNNTNNVTNANANNGNNVYNANNGINVSKWKDKRLNETNFNTTISKYISG